MSNTKKLRKRLNKKLTELFQLDFLVYESGLSKTSKTFGVDVEFLVVSPGVVTREQFCKISGVVFVIVVYMAQHIHHPVAEVHIGSLAAVSLNQSLNVGGGRLAPICFIICIWR